VKKSRVRLISRLPALPLAAGALVVLSGSLAGWLATQDPLPETLPYYVTLPVEAPAPTETAEIPAEEPDTAITMSAVDAAPDEGEAASGEGETTQGQAEPAATDDGTDTPTETVADAGTNDEGWTSLKNIGLGARASSMQPAPHPALIEQGRYGLMPIISADGRESWQVYARPFNDANPSPLIALVFTELGMSRAKTHKVLQLPGEVTLAFSPYAEGLDEWVRQARAGGHEVLLEVPMEPPSYPSDDPGPRALLTSLGPTQNLDRLDWLLGRFQGYVGIMESMGGRFATSPLHLEPVLDALKRRGLMYVDRRRSASAVSSGMANDIDLLRVGAEIEIDFDPAPREIERRLVAAENRAQRTGSVVLVAHPYPVTVNAVRDWLGTLEEKAMVLAPLTAVAARQATSE